MCSEICFHCGFFKEERGEHYATGKATTKQYKLRLYLHALVLLSCEFLRADGSYRDVSSNQRRMLH